MIRSIQGFTLGITLCVVFAFLVFVTIWASRGYALRTNITAGTVVPSFTESQHEKPDTSSSEDTAGQQYLV